MPFLRVESDISADSGFGGSLVPASFGDEQPAMIKAAIEIKMIDFMGIRLLPKRVSRGGRYFDNLPPWCRKNSVLEGGLLVEHDPHSLDPV